MKYVFSLIILLVISSSIYSQENVKDTTAFKQSEDLLFYAQKINAASTDSAIQFLDSLIIVYENQNFKKAHARAISLKSWLLAFQAKYKSSITIAYDALGICREINDSMGIALTLNRIGLYNMYFERYKESQSFIKESLEYFLLLKDTVRIDMVINNLGVLASEQKMDDEAISYYKQSLAIRLKRKSYHWVAFSYYNIGSTYTDLNQLDSALKYMMLSAETFSHKTEHKKIPALASFGIAEMYEKRDEFSNALKWAQKAQKDAFAMNHTEVVLGSKKLLAKILYEKKDYEKAFEVLSAYEEQKVKIDSANNYAKVAEVEAKYNTAEQKAEIAQLKAENLLIKNKSQHLWLVALLVLIFVLGMVFLIIVLYQRKFQKQAIAALNLKNQVSDMRMIALKAQMNPHFIFNCINTTQNFVINSNKEAAYDYLTQFAHLLRLVLENSNKKLVPLEDELTQIKLYIELEMIRFDGKFNYQLEVDDALKNGVYEIPGMMIQPLIENAILHGMNHRSDDKGFLNINIKKQTDSLLIEIHDNGVGRLRSAEIKAKKIVHFQSVATPNINERIKILQSLSAQKIKIETIDLEEGNNASGTLVKLWLPLD